MGFDIKCLEFDPTGVSPTNLITDEIIEIPDVVDNKAIVLKHGAFYIGTLELSTYDGEPLTKWVDYKPVRQYTDKVLRTGKANASFILINRSDLRGRVRATYQAVGYPGGMSAKDMVDIITAIANDRRDFYWDNINNKPGKFPPLPHTLNVKDTFNWLPITDSMKRFAEALMNLDKLPDLTTIGDRFDEMMSDITTKYNELEARLLAHERSYNNPHGAQKNNIVGLENVDNFRMANEKEALQSIKTLFLSPYTAKAAAMYILQQNDKTAVHVGRVPMVQFGDLTNKAITYGTNGFVLTISEEVPAIIASKEYVLPVTSIDLSKQVDIYQNVELFIYVRIRNGAAVYEIAPAASPETTTYMNVGRVLTNQTGIASVAITKVSGVGTVRVSEVQIGSAISVTGGLPSQTGTFSWE